MLSNDVAKLDVGGAQYSCLCRDDGGILDDLFSYRLDDDRYLTVTNAANRDTDFAWLAEHAAGFDAELRDAGDDYAMLAVQGPRARELVARPRRRRAAGADADGTHRGRGRRRRSSAGPATRARTGSSCCSTPSGARRLGRAARRRARPRRASVPATRCGSRSASTSTATTSTTERNPIEAGLGWCCKEETGFIGSEAIAAARADGPGRATRPVRAHRARHPAPGQRRCSGGEDGRRGDQRTHSPSLGIGIGMAYVRSDLAEPGTEIEIDVRGKRRPAHRVQAPVQARRRLGAPMADESYPEDLRYHPEHDWARIEGEEATLGITWYAQDALGEVVFYEPPEVGSEIVKDRPTPRSSRSRPSPTSTRRSRARSPRSTRRWATTPRRSTRIPTERAGSSR